MSSYTKKTQIINFVNKVKFRCRGNIIIKVIKIVMTIDVDDESKVQKIILELNKAGLSYLKFRRSPFTQLILLKRSNTSKRPKR